MKDYFEEKVHEAENRVGENMERMLGSGLRQPFSNTNSGQRKLMFKVHSDHVMPLNNGVKAHLETGYEIRFGDESSSIVTTDSDYRVVKKISKFSFSPNHCYWLLLEDIRNKKLDVHYVTYGHYVTESYGYLHNNQYVDSLKEGDIIPQGTIIQKSLAFDEYMNRKDGRELLTVYLSLDQNQEDSVMIRDECAEDDMASSTIDPIDIMINENKIPLNLYGTDDRYKCIPDIGEHTKDSILIALRTEKKEEIVFTKSVSNLKRIMMSDEKKMVSGVVVDVDVYCNNPSALDSYHYAQFKMYYEEKVRVAREFVTSVAQYQMNGYELSYQLNDINANSKRLLNGDQFIDKNTFSNIELKVTVVEKLPLREGDKLSDRYGGKGVVSKIFKTEDAPVLEDGRKIDIIKNKLTMYGRMNPGQIFELHIKHVAVEVVKYIETKCNTVNEGLNMILKFYHYTVPELEASTKKMFDAMTDEDKAYYLESVTADKIIDASMKPISESFDIDKLATLYEAFPFATSYTMKVPIRDSNGNIRFINARRKVIVAPIYNYRLKQFAEEKFSATSLSSTNLKGVNTKSKANKNYNKLYSDTPIRFGNMEINNENHLGAEIVIENLMIHSVSPHGRKLVEKMYTDDPFNINIRLDEEATNREAEVVNVYLKAIGKKLVFKKIPKYRVKIPINPVYFVDDPVKSPIRFLTEEERRNIDLDQYYKNKDKLEQDKANNPNLVKPIRFYGIDLKRRKQQMEINEKAMELKRRPLREIAEEMEREDH